MVMFALIPLPVNSMTALVTWVRTFSYSALPPVTEMYLSSITSPVGSGSAAFRTKPAANISSIQKVRFISYESSLPRPLAPHPFRQAAIPELERPPRPARSEEHTSELQSQFHLVCRLL